MKIEDITNTGQGIALGLEHASSQIVWGAFVIAIVFILKDIYFPHD